MKCDKCKFQHCQSNECGTEYYCEIFGYDVPEEFVTDEGCNLRHNEAKKLCELSEKYYDSMYLYCGLYDGESRKEKQDIKALQDYRNVLLNRRKK